MKIDRVIRPAQNIWVSDLEYHDRGDYAGYISGFTTINFNYVVDTLFRVSDHRNADQLSLVYIGLGWRRYPEVQKYWYQIEKGFIDISRSLQLPLMSEKNVGGFYNYSDNK